MFVQRWGIFIRPTQEGRMLLVDCEGEERRHRIGQNVTDSVLQFATLQQMEFHPQEHSNALID
jgi:hypothetical protein